MLIKKLIFQQLFVSWHNLANIDVLEPAIDPNNRMGFLLDWELTMKCNLDCTYCTSGLNGGHDNSTQHPPVEDCVRSIDFMLAYADLYMQHKPAGLRNVFLNVYGGESLHHPEIEYILQQVQLRYTQYQDKWPLTITTTTNAIVSPRILTKIIPYIDEFTVSYHTESSDKQKSQFRENLLAIKNSGKRLKAIVMMHNQPDLFADAQEMIAWLDHNQIKYLSKQIDNRTGEHPYTTEQIVWFNKIYQSRSYNTEQTAIQSDAQLKDLSDTGRACCGGRQFCDNQNYRQRNAYVVDNKFPDWYCSVNWFFLFIKQVTNEIYVNKDCKMNFAGGVGPIGKLDDADKLLSELAQQLSTGTVPIIQCKKYNCWCGLCAPKAKDLATYQKIISKYQKDYTL